MGFDWPQTCIRDLAEWPRSDLFVRGRGKALPGNNQNSCEQFFHSF